MIESINGIEVHKTSDVTSLVSAQAVGCNVVISLKDLSSGKSRKVSVTLASDSNGTINQRTSNGHAK